MRKHLSRHGLNVEPKRLQMTNDITATILNYVAETRPDLLVMGGMAIRGFANSFLVARPAAFWKA